MNWEQKKFNPIVPVPPPTAYRGTPEPGASQGMAHFVDPCRDKFVEGFTVLDYGCGTGILSNFISERLSNFNYFGLEPKSSHGIEGIQHGKTLFADTRTFFGFIEEDLDYCLSQKPDAIILISIFTHLLIEDIRNILDNLIKVFDVNPDCNIIFSCFLDPLTYQRTPQPQYGERFYSNSFIKEDEFYNYCNENNLVLSKMLPFQAPHGLHYIFKITKE